MKTKRVNPEAKVLWLALKLALDEIDDCYHWTEQPVPVEIENLRQVLIDYEHLVTFDL